MTDDEPTEEDLRHQRLRRAQGAAGDLARMGIDPRSLGLEDTPPPPAPTPAAPPVDPDAGAAVVELRPGTARIEPAAPAPAKPAAGRPPSRVEQLLARPPADVPPTRSAGRLVRTVARGVVTPDAAGEAEDERRLVETVRQRQSDRRLVAFVSGKGGVGCTTMAVAIGTAFMALREDRTVVVDVQGGTASLGRLYGVDDPLSVGALLRRTELASPPTNAAGLGLVDGAGWDAEISRGDVTGVLERLGEEHVFHLFDAGNDAGDGSRSALARADQVVLVTGPGASGAAATGTALDRLRYVNPAAADAAVHVIVCPHEPAYRQSVREVAAANAAGPLTAVAVPPDPHLALGLPYDPQRVSEPFRTAALRVAAAVAAGGRAR